MAPFYLIGMILLVFAPPVGVAYILGIIFLHWFMDMLGLTK